MKHGIKLRKLGRTSSHRQALLRNLVSALLHHETIKTTVPKAKEAARMTEKIITLGKRGTDPSWRKAQSYLMPPHTYNDASVPLPTPPTAAPGLEGVEGIDTPKTLLHKLFTVLAKRYEDRPGGYTRIAKFGNRPGDNAPVAIVSLVDGPRDIKFEMTARAVAREAVVGRKTSTENKKISVSRAFSGFRRITQRNAEQVLKYRGDEGRYEFSQLADGYAAQLEAEKHLNGERKPAPEPEYKFNAHSINTPKIGRRVFAGERLPSMGVSHTGLGLARAALGKKRV